MKLRKKDDNVVGRAVKAYDNSRTQFEMQQQNAEFLASPAGAAERRARGASGAGRAAPRTALPRPDFPSPSGANSSTRGGRVTKRTTTTRATKPTQGGRSTKNTRKQVDTAVHDSEDDSPSDVGAVAGGDSDSYSGDEAPPTPAPKRARRTTQKRAAPAAGEDIDDNSGNEAPASPKRTRRTTKSNDAPAATATNAKTQTKKDVKPKTETKDVKPKIESKKDVKVKTDGSEPAATYESVYDEPS